MTPLRRELLGGYYHSGYERQAVYLIDHGLEIDVIEGYQVQRVRVFFEDVRMLSLHYRRPTVLPWLTGLFTGFVGLCCLIGLSNMPDASLSEQWGRVFGCLLFFTPFFLIFFASLRSRLYLTVHGNRSKATMQWTWRRSRAEPVYLRLKQMITDFQQAKRALVAELQREAPSAFAAPPADLPLPPLSFSDPPVLTSGVPQPPAQPSPQPTATNADPGSAGTSGVAGTASPAADPAPDPAVGLPPTSG